MSKTNIILLVVISIILVAGGVALYFVLSPKTPTTPSAARNVMNETDTSLKVAVMGDKTYEDTAGFSFKHPKQFTVKDITPVNDDNYYSKVEVNGQEGKVVLVAIDTTYKLISEWQSVNKDASLVGSSLFGDIKANQYKKGNSLITIAIDQSVLYTIENINDNSTLDEVHNLILSTFKFADQKTTTAQQPSDVGVEYEEEEVIE